MLRHLLQPVIRHTRTRVRSYHVSKEVAPPTMDEVIVPSGSWKEANSKRQQKNNLQLLAGIVILGGTIAFGEISGLFWFNFYPPVPKDE